MSNYLSTPGSRKWNIKDSEENQETMRKLRKRKNSERIKQIIEFMFSKIFGKIFMQNSKNFQILKIVNFQQNLHLLLMFANLGKFSLTPNGYSPHSANKLATKLV